MSERFGLAALRVDLQTRLNFRLPAIVAPMFLVSGPELVAEACASGMIGALPSLNARTTEEFAEWLQLLNKEASGQASARYAVNLVTHSSNPRFEADLAATVSARAPLVITALGSPAPALEAVHSYGGIVFADVNSPKLARKAAQAGADGLVLVCAGAGGHTGVISPFAFVDEVRSFFDGPVVLAGAVSSGRAVRAARQMGADLAAMGTRFLAADESRAVDDYKNMVVGADYSDIIATDAITGALANKLRPSLVRAGIDPDSLVSGKAFDLSKLESNTKKWRDLWSAGQGVGMSRARQPASQIIAQLIREYETAA